MERLEALIGEFNIFDAVGMAHQEIRHSNFLAYLLNPRGSHGLGDRFLKRFLIRALVDAGQGAAMSPIEIDVADFGSAVVERESDHIDILIHDVSNKLICIIENKVYSGEHDYQLMRYIQSVRQRFVDRDLRVIPIFLTPEGDPPTDERYLILSYKAVAHELERLRVSSSSTIGPDVNTAMRHYVTMLGRHIVTDSEIARLCQQIYQRHKAAIDLIVEHMPNMRSTIGTYVTSLVQQSPELLMEHSSLSNVRFSHVQWATVRELNLGTGWANSEKIVNFQIYIYADSLSLYLIVGPGEQSVREALFALAHANPTVFPGRRSSLSKLWTSLYKYPILTKGDFEDVSFDELQSKIDLKWEHFRQSHLPAINERILSLPLFSDHGS